MRMHFEPEQDNEFEAGKDLLIRRCTAWAREQDMAADPFILSATLDFRHHSIDGRLGFWTVDLVREFLLTWIPQRLSVTADDAADTPDTLRTLLCYLRHTDLDDSTGDTLPDLEAAVSTASGEFRQAMSDERNFGIAKFWVMQATASGIDPTDAVAMQRFTEDAQAGRIEHDDAALGHIVTQHLLRAGSRQERAYPQLPVSLPPRSDLAAMAEETRLVGQLRALTDWVGRDGRVLTATGQLKLADARELVALLGTRDVIDPVIGDRVYRTKSSAELTELTLVLDWARKIRLIRVVKNRLVQIAKSQPLLRDGLALWTRAFDTFVELADTVVRPVWQGQPHGMLHELFEDVVPDVLNAVYGIPEPIPVVRLEESVWLSCQAAFEIDSAGRSQQAVWRRTVSSDLGRILHVLADVGGLVLSTGSADPMFHTDLDDDGDGVNSGFGVNSGATVLPQDTRERLRAALAPDAGPVEIVTLSPLGTHAVRARLLEQGRNAPLVGELSDATPAQLLGMIAEQHTPKTGQEEIAGWLAGHGGEEVGLDRLLDAVRRCPFRSRTAAMLDALTAARPDRAALLRRLRSDTTLGPIAVQFLVLDGQLGEDDLTDREQLLAITEQLLQLLEIAGPDVVRETLTAEAPAAEVRNLFGALTHSGHPDTTGLDELRTLVIEPLQRHSSGRRIRTPGEVRRSTRRPKRTR